MSDLFTRDELVALPPSDLHDLIELAPGVTREQRCRALGLDLSDPIDRLAAERATPGPCGHLGHPAVSHHCQLGGVPLSPSAFTDEPPYPEGPVIGAAQPGVRSDLTPEPATPDDAHTGEGAPLSEALGLPEPSEESAATVADLLAASAAQGVPFMAGTFALYGVPDGSVMLVTEDAAGEVKRTQVPPKMVRLALGLMAGKTPPGFGMLAKMLGKGRG